MTPKHLTQTALDGDNSFQLSGPAPVLLVAYAPDGTVATDRCRLSGRFMVGRDSKCDFPVVDGRISGEHLRLSESAGDWVVEDLGSSNGTFVNGRRIHTVTTLRSADLIRAGRVLFVFVRDGGHLLEPASSHRHGLAGRFYSGPLIKELEDAVRSFRHVLLTGPSGTGKELAASAMRAIHEKIEGKTVELIVHNAARFSSEEEASTTIFGVAPKVFSGVDSRAGLIELAGDGILFLDEIHNLPERVQRGLLRVIEDGQSARIGEAITRPVKAQFVLATNDPGPTRGLAPDLFARLRVIELPGLAERVADIPDIFNFVFKSMLEKQTAATVEPANVVNPDHYEALCLADFGTDNVRGLIDIADRITTRVSGGEAVADAVTSVFSKKFAESSVAKRRVASGDEGSNHYERNKDQILAVFEAERGNLSAVERVLKERNLKCSRRWLRFYLDKWGARS